MKNIENKKPLQINPNTFSAIMLSAISAYTRENWLVCAAESKDAGTHSTAFEYIAEKFEPYLQRFLDASTLNDVTVENARHGFFQMFSSRVLPEN